MFYAFLTYLYLTLAEVEVFAVSGLKTYFAIILITTVATALWYFVHFTDQENLKREWKEVNNCKDASLLNVLKYGLVGKIFFPKTLIAILLCMAILPSENTIKWVAGVYVTSESIDYLSSNEATKQLPANVLNAANKFLSSVDIGKGVEEGISKATEITDSVGDMVDSVKSGKEELINKSVEIYNKVDEKL